MLGHLPVLAPSAECYVNEGGDLSRPTSAASETLASDSATGTRNAPTPSHDSQSAGRVVSGPQEKQRITLKRKAEKDVDSEDGWTYAGQLQVEVLLAAGISSPITV